MSLIKIVLPHYILITVIILSGCSSYRFSPSTEINFMEELQRLIDKSPDGYKIFVKKGDYSLNKPLLIRRNIDIDFCGSTISTPCISVIKTAAPILMSKDANPTQVDSKKHLSHVGIKNLTVNCLPSKAETGRQRCIELHYVDDVVLSGITINNWNVASTSEKHNLYNQQHYGYPWFNDIGMKSYEIYMVAIRYYVTVSIDNCVFNDFETEGITLLPSINKQNYATITNNRFKSIYHSMVQICDGRCYIAYNECSGNNGSAFNAFCYDSEICYNKFFDGKRSAAIDLCEDGLYKSYNVFVHDNDCVDTYDLAYVCGQKIKLSNNRINSNKASCGIHIFNGKQSDWECNNTPLNQVKTESANIDITGNHFKDIKGYDIFSESRYISDISIIGNYFDKKFDPNSNQKTYYHFKHGVCNLKICSNIFFTLQNNQHSKGYLGLGEIYGGDNYSSNGHLIVCDNCIQNLDQLANKGLKGEQTFLVGGYNCKFDSVLVKNNQIPGVNGVSQPFISPVGLVDTKAALQGEVSIETDLDFYSGWKQIRNKN